MKKNEFYFNKNVLVAGGTGMVGQMLVPKLIKLGANVYISSLDHKSLCPKGIKGFYSKDLIYLENCIKVTKNKDIVFNLLGSTGSPKINMIKPASFMMSNLYCAINMLMASQINKVKNYLYTSTYGVYGKKGKMREDMVWKTFPSEHDKYAGWAKRIGELQAEAFNKEFNSMNISVVRPANIYGPHLNFNPTNSMVVASLIRRLINKEDPFVVWGDGSAIRDFVYSEDVANAMIKILQKKIKQPLNIGSGTGTTIKNLVKSMFKSKFITNNPKVFFDKSKPSGDKKRVLDMKLSKKYRISCSTNLETGLHKTIEWYLKFGKKISKKKYNYFLNKK
tara:strand:- start:12506 stop:13510 length:1005 start_codon:yes stop_codon:yes gene_type:complete